MKLIKKYYISDIDGRGFTSNFDERNKPQYRPFSPDGRTRLFDSDYEAEEFVYAHEQFHGTCFFIDSFYDAVDGEREQA